MHFSETGADDLFFYCLVIKIEPLPAQRLVQEGVAWHLLGADFKCGAPVPLETDVPF